MSDFVPVLLQVAVPVGMDIAAYDKFEPLWERPPDPAKFAKSFEVSPLQADLMQHFEHLLQV